MKTLFWVIFPLRIYNACVVTVYLTFLADMYADRISLCVHGRILAATFKSKQDIIFGLENISSLIDVAARENVMQTVVVDVGY